MLVSQREDHKHNFGRTRELADLLEPLVDPAKPHPSFGPSLLRFYAAESGLKYLLSKNLMIPFEYEIRDQTMPADTSDPSFPRKVEGYSHKLDQMLKRLKVSAARVPIPTGPFKTVGGYNGGQDFPVSSAHEAWRYGLEVDSDDQAALEKFIADILSYLEDEIL
ncbi:hypothetical protein QCE62_34720 [Caballeronia sp. LZ033]|uniref:hypothetical protein n=1 Tax=Caballeronia sp. LZ033 TaxID=3038566 RepID=UPI002861CC22|nr:hypothetical protein [Caballeronia sp. LZ033]MDR5818782.1 hypothetical protein [Caballeronia sp. LZ033]